MYAPGEFIFISGVENLLMHSSREIYFSQCFVDEESLVLRAQRVRSTYLRDLTTTPTALLQLLDYYSY